MKKRVTLADVAKAAGVSTATVSLGLRDSPQIPARTKRRVKAAAAKSGYVYNQSAANMRGSNQTLVGMVMSGSSNRFNAEVVAEFSRHCARNGQVMLYGDADEDIETQTRILERMVENNVTNVFVCAAEGSAATDFGIAMDHGVRLIQILRNVTDLHASYIGYDNSAALEQLTVQLIRDGHERIAFVGGQPTSSSREERRFGFMQALRKSGIEMDPAIQLSSPVTRKGGFEAMGQLLALESPPTAVVCYNDIVAFGAMLRLRAEGLEVGRDVAVTGFDDLEESSLWSPDLTSVALDQARLVSQAFGALGEGSVEKEGVNVAIKPRIILRRSTLDWRNPR